MLTSLVVVGGAPATQLLPEGLDPTTARVIAADSGLDLVEALGWHCDLVVGDLDSVSAGALERARAACVVIEPSSPHKDETDLELALWRAVAEGSDQIIAVGGEGGRLDHLIGNIAALSSPVLRDVTVEAWMGTAFVAIVRAGRRCQLAAPVGSVVSVLAMHGDAHGVCATGLRWPLDDEVLPAGSCRGLSNEVVRFPAEVSICQGTVAVVCADASGWAA